MRNLKDWTLTLAIWQRNRKVRKLKRRNSIAHSLIDRKRNLTIRMRKNPAKGRKLKRMRNQKLRILLIDLSQRNRVQELIVKKAKVQRKAQRKVQREEKLLIQILHLL